MSDDRKTTFSKESRLTFGLAIACVGLAISGTWYVANVLARIDKKLEGALSDRWTGTDMERWAFQLERNNRTSTPPLVVPDVRTAQARKPD